MRVITKAPAKITRATIEAAWRQRAPGERLIVRDKECRGLALIVNATSMAWSFSYRPRGVDSRTNKRWPNRTVTLGNPASHSPEAARTTANRIKGEVKGGADPAAEKKAAAEAERRKRSSTLGRLVGEYEHVLPQRQKMRGAGLPSAAYAAIELAQVRLALRAMDAEETPAADLSSTDVRKLLSAGTNEGGNTRARFGALSRFLDWAQDAGHITTNPCTEIARARRPRAPQAREHYLTLAELARLWHAAEELSEPVWRDLTRFLIAIPCRRGEAAHLDWSHLNLTTAEWHQPGNLTKNGEPHRLHLHRLALELLEEQHCTAGQPRTGLVFPAPSSHHVITTFSALKMKLAEAAEFADWRWHDFRRSFATALGETGVPEAVADAILNHRQSATRGGVLGVYQKASRWPEQMRAMELWGRLLNEALHPANTATNVLPMTARTG